jgi:beta-mannosidase
MDYSGLETIVLAQGWQFKQRDNQQTLESDFASSMGWKSAVVPGTVHQDLLAHEMIPDPFFGLNELEVQWVGETDWLYKLEFAVSAEALVRTVELCFDGLDTFATVWLNGTLILEAENMFVSHRVPVNGSLRAGKNELQLVFASAMNKGLKLEQQHGKRANWNGDSSRLYVRKAQYHYGWDWGPTLMTAGIWRGVRLEVFEARITDLHCPVEVSADLTSAVLPVTLELTGRFEDAEVRLSLMAPNGTTLQEITLAASQKVTQTFTVEQPELWWTNGLGAQPLYQISAHLEQVYPEHRTTTLDQCVKRFGMRRLRVLQEPFTDEAGLSFTFEINNVPIFCGGANWIPDDSFLPRITAARYFERLTQVRDANMNMLRVWGGGIYEDDAFYDGCDELGLLVWQDFMFACGLYPAHPEFQASVKLEAENNLRRLRHHACIALWCGNNEDYAVAESSGVYDPHFEGDFLETSFPARALYERVLPEVCAHLDPTRTYWRGSPYTPFGRSDDQTVGDRHTWDVWHGAMAKYQEYATFEGRFVSEFGMQSAPALSTVLAFTEPSERNPASRTMDHHNKAPDGPRRLAVYLSDTVPFPIDLADYVYKTQLVQALALESAYGSWRRRFQGPGKHFVSGALVWQINDCWPVTSWAIIDSHGLPKPAYYAVKRQLAAITMGLAHGTNGINLWATNAGLKTHEYTLELCVFDLSGAQIAATQRKVTLEPNRATELGTWETAHAETAMVAARLLDGDTVVARGSLFPDPLKYVSLPDPELTMTLVEPGRLRLRVQRPAKGVWLHASPDVIWSDNLLDLMPNEERILEARGLNALPEARWLKGR